MVDKIKRVSNPLTIIAIFAGLAEVASTVALGLVGEKIQMIFIWFVMGFPCVLVVGFFITLNFNPKVLYAPSDFSNEDNFMHTLTGNFKLGQEMSQEIKEISHIVDESKSKLGNVSEAVVAIGIAESSAIKEGNDEDSTEIKMSKKELKKLIDNMALIEEKLKDVEDSANEITEVQLSKYRKDILNLLYKSHGVSVSGIFRITHIPLGIVKSLLNELVNNGLVERVDKGEKVFYRIPA